MEIITKFNIGTGDMLPALMEEVTREKFSALVSTGTIEKYIDDKFDRKVLMADLNNIANQVLVVYVDNKPAGYAHITAKGQKPEVLGSKRGIRLAEFGLLQQYNEDAVRLSLFEKCMLVTKSYDGVWINEYAESSLISFFESKGFVPQDESFGLEGLPLPAKCLVKLRV